MHLENRFSRFVKTQFAPPNYLTLPTVGIDISSSAIKIASLAEHVHGLELESFIEEKIPAGAVSGGEVSDKETISRILREIAKKHSIVRANISLPETRGYLFETTIDRNTPDSQRLAIEQHLDEYVPLPPAEVLFDTATLSKEGDRTHVVGIGYAHRVIDELLLIFDEAGIQVPIPCSLLISVN
jgi:Tfp pilus assembly PilM family ATPase